ncbi:MAG: YggS family pyridoxal phosphate-dependent enzyme [Rhodospirillaceae bacterium]|nr:YggS family pyridoxal phosphate-dependent enzyme [Rhodospirillaceae bacterium]MAI49622.1 YggS family pyridoxal phosphate-dependent enzyme [Rhodospirillaceae bacterium]|tara:strand:- start:448 stop:1164 length:717 start_codon:yes stop_codon:yes gene_type:complete
MNPECKTYSGTIKRPTEIADNLAAVEEKIAAAASDTGRDPSSISLISVSKSHPASAASGALAAGHRVFGENRVQETEGKWPSLRAAYPDANVHLIGPLQTNKTADAVALFDAIQTVDREKLARNLAEEMARQDRHPDLFIQVNTGEEPQKAGVLPLDADAFIAKCRVELDLPVVGLMCIPPVDENPALHFALLAEMAARNGLDRLSMGMSADYETAVRLGATEVRVGTAIFGTRPQRS